MQEAVEKTTANLSDPHTHSREIEKKKLLPSSN